MRQSHNNLRKKIAKIIDCYEKLLTNKRVFLTKTLIF